MALPIGSVGGGSGTLYGGSDSSQHCLRRPILFSPSPNPRFFSLQLTARNANVVAAAAKKLSSGTGKFDSKNRRRLGTTTKEEVEEEERTVQIETDDSRSGGGSVDASDVVGDDGSLLPELPGEKPDFWEGPQWDVLGFLVQYLWAFGILFALIACGIAVATYNEGATDFKETPVYMESVQSRELLEEPEGSSSDVFESNPTEEAPSLE